MEKHLGRLENFVLFGKMLEIKKEIREKENVIFLALILCIICCRTQESYSSREDERNASHERTTLEIPIGSYRKTSERITEQHALKRTSTKRKFPKLPVLKIDGNEEATKDHMYDEETRNDNENVLNVSEKVHSKDEEPNFSLGISISSQVWLVCF